MGTGVNVQQRLKAMHHLDVPWLPSQIEQCEGRIERQGNRHDEIDIYAYATLGSMDFDDVAEQRAQGAVHRSSALATASDVARPMPVRAPVMSVTELSIVVVPSSDDSVTPKGSVSGVTTVDVEDMAGDE